MNTANIITLDSLGASPQSAPVGKVEGPRQGGINFRDVMKSLAGNMNAVPATTTGSIDLSQQSVYVPADSPIITAVKLLQKADANTLSAVEELANAAGGTIPLEETTPEELLAELKNLGVSDEAAEKVIDILNAFEAAGAADITPETVEIEPSFAEAVIGASKESLAEVATTLFPDLYETAGEAMSDAENFPVQIKLIPLVIVNGTGVTVEIPAEKQNSDGLSLSTDEITETAKVLSQLDAESLSRIQNLLAGNDITIYEAVRALSAVPASATEFTEGGIIGINVTEADFLSADSVLARIAANNPNMLTAEDIALSDSNIAILEELQTIVKEVIINQTPAENVSVRVDPLFESRFRERINKLYEGADLTDTLTESSGAAASAKAADADDDIVMGTTQRRDFSASTDDSSDDLLASGNSQPSENTAPVSRPQTVSDNPFAAARPVTVPLTEIASQPAPFISTGGEVAPEMQIGNRILEMKTEADGVQEMTVVLKPRELGEVAIKIVTTAGEVSVTLSAANPETAKILDRSTLLLSSQLQEGGVNIRDILTIAPSSASEDMGLNFANGEFSAGNGNGGQGQSGRQGRQLGEEPLTGEIDGEFTPDDFMQRRMSLWRSA
jgi:hypothetical protein